MIEVRAPKFWQRNGFLAHVLEPLGRLYGIATFYRLARHETWKSPIPTVCIGNLIAGGTGKTPVAISITEYLYHIGLHPILLSRGYGGTVCGPLQVRLERHSAQQVGDEALLLATHAPTILAQRRVAGIRFAVSMGAQIVVMDDGHQDPSVHKDITFIVVDAAYGFGNKRLLPAGPLREPVEQGLPRASALVVMETERERPPGRWLSYGLPVLQAYLVPGPESALLKGRRVVAFAGIGYPEKFFTTLRTIGACLIACYSFSDHKLYTKDNIKFILKKASTFQAVPVTTAKDAVRLSPEQRRNIFVLNVTLSWYNESILKNLLKSSVCKNTI